MIALFLLSAAAPSTITRTIPTTDFHAVDLAVKASVSIEQAPDTSVTVTGDPRLVRCVAMHEQGGRVTVGWAQRGEESERNRMVDKDIVVTARAECPHQGSIQNLKIRVAAPLIDQVTIREQSDVHIMPARVTTFFASIPGRGSIVINGLRAETTKLSIAGIGQIISSGDLGRLTISVSGAGTIDAKAAHASAINVDFGGQGSVAATVYGPATGVFAGKGTIAISGRPVCTVRNAGRGRVICPAA